MSVRNGTDTLGRWTVYVNGGRLVSDLEPLICSDKPVRVVPCDQASLERAARAVHEVTGGGAPFGSPKSKTKVSAALLVETVVRALGATE